MKLCILMLCFLVCFRSSWSEEQLGEEDNPELKKKLTNVNGQDTKPPMTNATDKKEITNISNGTFPTFAPTAAAEDDDDDGDVTKTNDVVVTTAADVANTTASNITMTTAASNITMTTAHNNVMTTADVDVSTKKHTKHTDVKLKEKWQKLLSVSSKETIKDLLEIVQDAAKVKGILDEQTNIEQNAAPTTAESIGQTSTIQTTGENDTTTTPSDTLPSITSTSLPDTTKESSDQDPTTGTDNGNEDPKSHQPPNNGGNNNPGNDDKESESHKSDTGVEKNNPGPRPLNRTPESSHFAVVFLVIIALLFGLYALYHNRQKIIAVVIEGRSVNGRGGRDRYRKLDSESGMEPEARIKNSNEVYVY